MGKAVLISIRPERCKKIANGEETVEVRKPRPNLKPPFRCYIYCTSGTIIGEFICRKIDRVTHGGDGYGWHISGLKVYDAPFELSEFRRPCKHDLYCENCAMYMNHCGICGNPALHLCRPPQNWYYVAEKED